MWRIIVRVIELNTSTKRGTPGIELNTWTILGGNTWDNRHHYVVQIETWCYHQWGKADQHYQELAPGWASGHWK